MKVFNRQGTFRHPSFTEVTLLFVELKSHQPGSAPFNKVLDQITTKLYYIPSTIVQKYKWSNSKEELLSAGLEALAKSISKYDFKKNNNFFLYSYPSIKGAIHKEQKREIEWTEVQKVSQPVEECENILIVPTDPEDNMIREQTLEFLEKIINTLDLRSRKVLSMYLGLEGDKKSLRQIAKELGICHETARKIRDEAVDKIVEVFRKREQ